MLTVRLRDALPCRLQDAARLLLDTLSVRRRAARAQAHEAAAPTRELARRVSPNGRVLAGPFKGLRLPLEASWGGLAARLAGAYEEELTDLLSDLTAGRPPRVLDVGAAEGYYAVGLAQALPDAQVYAFDLDPGQRRLCRKTARLNHVRTVRVRGRVDPRRLQRYLVPGALVLSDCEGFEDVLMDPALVPGLLDAALVVELHEFAAPGVTERVLSRFRASHEVQLIVARPRAISGLRQLDHLPVAERNAAVNEGRPTVSGPMQWAVMRPRPAAAASR